jgi:hypothetical protein
MMNNSNQLFFNPIIKKSLKINLKSYFSNENQISKKFTSNQNNSNISKNEQSCFKL